MHASTVQDNARCSDDREADRLNELYRYEVLDTPRDGAFEDITRLAARYFNVPIAIVSLVDRDRVWFKSAVGLDGIDQIARGPGLCASAIMQDGVYVASELRNDPDSLANPLVACESGFRFYAATPLKGENGFNLGTFCLIDTVPRSFSDENRRDLEIFGGLVMTQMEQRLSHRKLASAARSISERNVALSREASHDPLTGLYNRAAAARLIAEMQSGPEGEQQSAVLLLDIDKFKSVNDTYGHHAGDAVLVEVAHRIRDSVRATDHAIRYGGEEFLVILRKCPEDRARVIAQRIRNAVEKAPVVFEGVPLAVTISGGLFHSPSARQIEEMIRSADGLLYSAKRAGRNRIATCDDLAA